MKLKQASRDPSLDPGLREQKKYGTDERADCLLIRSVFLFLIEQDPQAVPELREDPEPAGSRISG